MPSADENTNTGRMSGSWERETLSQALVKPPLDLGQPGFLGRMGSYPVTLVIFRSGAGFSPYSS